jgi:hypothetical protein
VEYHEMARTKLIDRAEPSVIPRTHAPVRSRLPQNLRLPMLVALNLGLSAALWSAASNFLNPELGVVSRVPREGDHFSQFSPVARLAIRVALVWMNWHFNYDCEHARRKSDNLC